MKHSPQLARLIDALRTLPGVGPKSAQRMAFHLLQEGRPGARSLAEALTAALSCVKRCQRCRMLTEEALCVICAASQRDAALLCAVESPADVVAIESSGSYRGRYFVLMGHLSPLDGIGPEQLGMRELGRSRRRRVRGRSSRTPPSRATPRPCKRTRLAGASARAGSPTACRWVGTRIR
jgi:recombination protein RecR